MGVGLNVTNGAPAGRQRLAIRTVIRRTFRVLMADIGPISVLSAILAVLPVSVGAALGSRMGWEDGDYRSGGFEIASFVLGIVLLGALITITAGHVRGQPVGGRKALWIGLKRFFPLLLLTLLTVLGVVFGLLLLVVPGVFLSLMWVVNAPVLALERGAFLDAFGRSADLTKGNRLRVLALLLLCVLVMAAMVVANVVLGFVDPALGLVVGSGLISGVASALVGVGVTVLYFELKRIKDQSAA